MGIANAEDANAKQAGPMIAATKIVVNTIVVARRICVNVVSIRSFPLGACVSGTRISRAETATHVPIVVQRSKNITPLFCAISP